MLLRQDAAQWGPCGAARGRRKMPEGWRAGCAPVRCMHMDVHSANPGTRSRTRRAGCPESALLGVCFFRLPFFAQAKKGDSLARRASESFALERARMKMDSRFRGNDDSAESYGADAPNTVSTGATCASRPSARATRASLSVISTFPLAHNVAWPTLRPARGDLP